MLPRAFRFSQLFKLLLVLLCVFAIALVPFVSSAEDKQERAICVIQQFFGTYNVLSDQFIAPNIWALYFAIDKLIVLCSSETLEETGKQPRLCTFEVEETPFLTMFLVNSTALLTTLQILPKVVPWLPRMLSKSEACFRQTKSCKLPLILLLLLLQPLFHYSLH